MVNIGGPDLWVNMAWVNQLDKRGKGGFIGEAACGEHILTGIEWTSYLRSGGRTGILLKDARETRQKGVVN